MTIEALLEKPDVDHLAFVADIVAAFVSNNSVPLSELPALISSVHASLANLGSTQTSTEVDQPLIPAVSIKKSVTPDFLICLEDGRKFKSLKRHLGTTYQMTPDEYRSKWGLPRDYPMVAPAYSATRSALAKSSGLGVINARAAAAKVQPDPKVKGPAKGGGRPKKLAA